VTEGRIFPTFCHIGEYNEAGYRILHQMLAISEPLILWAPTSRQLEDEGCRVRPRAFLRFVEEGRIRVYGRERWLTSQSFRDSRPLAWAHWNESFDGALKRLCEKDASRPERERRVVVAEDEGGWAWSEKHLQENPEQVALWNQIARSESADSQIPAGTLESAFRYADDDPARLAQAILRDAYNHGQAIRQSGAEAPFLLSASDRQFLEVLKKTADHARSAKAGKDGTGHRHAGAAHAQMPPLDKTSAELATQLIEVLDLLDIGASGSRRAQDLDAFLAGEGHRELVAWLSRMCIQLRQTDARNLDNAVFNALRADLDQAHFAKPLREMIKHPDATSVGAVGLVTTVMGFATDPTGPLSIVGLLASAYPIAKELFQSLGYVPDSFSGPQWPFLYSSSSPATKRKLARLRNILSEE
jgi:hypothetical protein